MINSQSVRAYNNRTISLGQMKKISVFRVMGLKNVGKVAFFAKKNIILCILEEISPFKTHKIIYISRKPVNLGSLILPLTQIKNYLALEHPAGAAILGFNILYWLNLYSKFYKNICLQRS